jgi:hypothetical protein
VKSTLLRWSKLRYTFPNPETVVLGITVHLRTRGLTVPYLSEDRQKRLRLLHNLYESGLSTQTISDLLNTLQIKTPRGKKYSSELVWVTIDKWKKRQHRLIDEYTTISVPTFYTTSEGENDD